MHSRPKLHAPATQVPRQDPASTTCPRTRRPALRLVRSTIHPAAPACRPKLYIPAPVPHKTSPLHHLPARSSSCAVVYHAPSASCPCRSTTRVSASRSFVVLFHALSIVVPDSQRALP